MAIYALGRTQQFSVLTDFDVVIVRQEVRQRARQLGLDLRAQARLTAVISNIAREFLAIACALDVTVSQSEGPRSAAMELLCAVPPGHTGPGSAALDQILGPIRALVDEVAVGGEAGSPVIVLRVSR